MTAKAIREKASARRILIILVGLLVTVMALQGLASVKPGGFEAFAQTATPTPGSAVIKLVNPDSTTGGTQNQESSPVPGENPELSTKNDGTDSAYHLVAWVNRVPSGAVVEFKYQASGADREDTVCTGTLRGSDTFDCFWNMSGIAEGDGTITAVLFSNGVEQSRDSEAVTVNNQDRTEAQAGMFSPEDQAETVEITYPTQSGSWGAYFPPGSARAVGIVEVTTSQAAGGDIETVEVFYSKAAPGAEPAFIPCNDGEPVGSDPAVSGEPGTTEDGVRCQLAEGDRPEAVTAIAARAADSDQRPGPLAMAENDSSDAHRALGYSQDPSSVTLSPQSHTATTGRCSQLITATITDSAGQQVAGANMDVHATGPVDRLSFGSDDDPATSEYQAPENHTSEEDTDCTAEPPATGSGAQGDHEVAGEGDIKHIESLTAADDAPEQGTDDQGRFAFMLFSPSDGQTQFTAWTDEDGNDEYCSAEAFANGSIGWNQGAASPTGVAPTQTSCPRPGATSTPTPTATSTTASPTATATTTGPSTSRTVTMAADKSKVPAGRQVTFSGQVLSSDQTCVDGEFVQIRRRIHGTTTYSNLMSTQTDSQGRFEFTLRPRRSADYLAVATAHDDCREAQSGEVTVLVKVIVQILASDKTPDRGDRIRIKSSVRPQHDGTTLQLQRKKGRRWKTIDRVKLNKRSIGNFVLEANFRRRTFRTRWKSQHADHETGTSKPVTIRT